MRMMMRVSVPVDVGNQAVRDGSLPETIRRFVEEVKPEACYFVADQGERTCYFIFDLKDPSEVPVIAEPFFMNLGATIELMPAMNLEEMRAGVERVMRAGRPQAA